MEMTSQAQTVCLENPRILPQILIVVIRPVFQERQCHQIQSSRVQEDRRELEDSAYRTALLVSAIATDDFSGWWQY